MRHRLAGLALGFLLLVGCGGDGGGGVSDPPATATVSGVVREQASGAPVAGAAVSLGGISTTSSANGQFQLQNVPIGAALNLAVSAPGHEPLTQSVEVRAGSNTVDISLVRTGLYAFGAYLVFLPPQVTTYRGVFVVMFGGTVDTRPLIRNELSYYANFPLSGEVADYRQRMLDFAQDNGFAVIGAAFGEQARDAGTASALMTAMSNVGNQSGHTELANVPFILHGHSSTACFAYEFALMHPNRTLGFIAAKSPCSLTSAAAVGVPGYFLFGENDPQVSADATVQVRIEVEQNRARGALWAFALEPGAGHAQVADQAMLFNWMRAIVAQRLPPTGTALQPVSEAAGWLGDHATFTIAAHACFNLNRSTASWLPTEQTARDWQAMISRGSVTTTLTC